MNCPPNFVLTSEQSLQDWDPIGTHVCATVVNGWLFRHSVALKDSQTFRFVGDMYI